MSKCYLCGERADVKSVERRYSPYQEIDCQNPNCVERRYEITNEALDKYFWLQYVGPKLDDKAKKKLIEWVKSQPEKEPPVLTAERVSNLTGIE